MTTRCVSASCPLSGDNNKGTARYSHHMEVKRKHPLSVKTHQVALSSCKIAVALLHGISVLERLPRSDILPACPSRVLIKSTSRCTQGSSRTAHWLDPDDAVEQLRNNFFLAPTVNGRWHSCNAHESCEGAAGLETGSRYPTRLRDNVYITPLTMHIGALRIKSYPSQAASSTPLPTSFYGPSGAALVPYGPQLAIYLFC